MKKIVTILLTVVMLFCLYGCGSNSSATINYNVTSNEWKSAFTSISNALNLEDSSASFTIMGTEVYYASSYSDIVKVNNNTLEYESKILSSSTSYEYGYAENIAGTKKEWVSGDKNSWYECNELEMEGEIWKNAYKYATFIKDYFSSFIYNENDHSYSGDLVYQSINCTATIKFENSKITQVKIVSQYLTANYSLTNYGTTTTTKPTTIK